MIIGISPDPPLKHDDFIKKKNLKIILLSDENKEVMVRYGVWQLKKSFGKEKMGVVRTTFLIDPEGIIKYVWRNVKVRKKKKNVEVFHTDEVKEKLLELSSQ